MPDPLFQKLFTDTEQLRPAPVEQVQARGRQRTHRQHLAVAAAALVLVVPAGAAFVLRQQHSQPNVVASVSPRPDNPTPSAVPAPSAIPAPASPSPRPATDPTTSTTPPTANSERSEPRTKKLTAVPVTAMLRAEDLGGSGWTTSDEDIGGDSSLAATIGYCPAAKRWATFGDPVHKRWRGISRGPQETGVVHEVLLYRPGGAQKYYNYFRQGAAACAKTVAYDTNMTVTIVTQGFAGARSVLIRVSSQYGDDLYGIVVHGDLASQFTVADGSEATGRRLGLKVRTLLCQATESC